MPTRSARAPSWGRTDATRNHGIRASPENRAPSRCCGCRVHLGSAQPSPPPRTPATYPSGDFNGDGIADLGIGVRLEDVGDVSDAGEERPVRLGQGACPRPCNGRPARRSRKLRRRPRRPRASESGSPAGASPTWGGTALGLVAAARHLLYPSAPDTRDRTGRSPRDAEDCQSDYWPARTTSPS